MNELPNPELIVVQKVVGSVLGELLAKQYGTANIEIKCQGGQIVAMRYGVEQSLANVHKIDPEHFDK